MPGSLITAHPELEPLLSERPQRAKLLDAMVRVVAEKGYDAATVADAVRLARVSRGTFYDLFESKEACLAAAYRLGVDVLATRVTEAVRDAPDWREELRLGLRAYLQTFDEEPLFARVYLVEWAPVPAERDAAIRRFARRYGRSFERGGSRVPDEALFLLAAGVSELVCAHVRTGGKATELEDVVVGCAVAARAKGGAMDLTFTEPETAFRDELRGWLADNDPGDPPDAEGEEASYEWRRDFQHRLADGGWAAVNAGRSSSAGGRRR